MQKQDITGTAAQVGVVADARASGTYRSEFDPGRRPKIFQVFFNGEFNKV